MGKIYGVFDGEYSDWGIVGFFKTKEEAEKYCCLHTDCYIYGMEDLTDKEDLSDVTVNYEYQIGFDLEPGNEKPTKMKNTSYTIFDFTSFTKTIRMRNEPNRYEFYSSDENRVNNICHDFNYGWLYFLHSISQSKRQKTL